MELKVKVVPAAKRNEIRPEGEAFKVYLNAPAVDGKANKALIEFFAQHYHVRKSQIQITKGLKSRNKVISISKI